MPFEDAIQLSESIEYPEGKNAITVEGTGDEGGLSSFAKVTLTVSPDHTLTADGINYYICTATVYDKSNPTATVVSLQTEETTADNPWYVGTGKLMKTFVGLWYNNNGVKGTDITGYVLSIKRDHVILGTELTSPDVIIEYYGNDPVTFDTSAPLIEQEHEDDVDWSLPSVSGEFLDHADVMVDGKYDTPATVSVRFVPTLDQLGQGYITANFGNGFDTQEILVEGGPSTYDIEVSSDPGSIAIKESAVITATVTQDNIPVTDGYVEFMVYHRSDLGYISPSTRAITTATAEEEVDSSYDYTLSCATLSISHKFKTLTSIIDVNGVDHTSDFDYVLDDSPTTLYMKAGFTSNPLEVVRVTIKYVYDGVATTSFTAYETATTGTEEDAVDDPVLISARYSKGGDNLCSVSITTDSSATGSLDMTADPDTLPKRTGDLADNGGLEPPTNGESLVTVSATNPGNILVTMTDGKGTPTSILLKDVYEDFVETGIIPSDVSTISVGKTIHYVTKITHESDNTTIASYTFDGNTITVDPALSDLSSVTVEYNGLADRKFYYTPELNWEGEVDYKAVQGDLTAYCTIVIGDATDTSGLSISVSANPSEVEINKFSRITAIVKENDVVVQNKPVKFELMPTAPATDIFGGMTPHDALGAALLSILDRITDVDGLGKVAYKSPKSGTITVKATTEGDTSATCTVKVNSTKEAGYDYVFEMIYADWALCVHNLDGTISGGTVNTNALFYKYTDKYAPMISVVSDGILRYVDTYGGVDPDPSKVEQEVIIGVYLPFIPIGYATYTWTVTCEGWTACSSSGGTVPENYFRSPMTSKIAYFKRNINFDLNNTDHEVTILNGGTTKAVTNVDGKATVAGQTQVIDPAKGTATFKGLPAGEHLIYITANGYVNNQPPTTYTPTTGWDPNPDNKKIMSKNLTSAKYILKATEVKVRGEVTVNSSEKHTWAKGTGVGYSYSVKSIKERSASTKATTTTV